MAQAPTPDEARHAYRDACAACHGVDGAGDGPVASALVSKPADLTRLSERHGGVFPRESVAQTIRGEEAIAAHGTREMPIWSDRFAPSGSAATAVASIYAVRQLEMLVDYVETLQRMTKLK